MKFVIAGGSGFIGRKLTDVLLSKNHEVIILTRHKKSTTKKITYVQWLNDGATPETEIGEADVVINLAGVSINDGRWSPTHQKEIYESRMMATDELIRIIHALKHKPSVLINASAIGIYPASTMTRYTEESTEVAQDFLGKTVLDWEQKAQRLEQVGIRVALMRFGVVLGDEGALPLMVMPYKFFVGGTVGSGNQWVSWIHVDDVIGSIIFTANNIEIRGPVNVTSPNPVQMKGFGQTIGKVLKRPHWLPVPGFAMKAILGQKSTLVLEGQSVMPEKLMQNGYKFSYPQLETALAKILKG